MVTISPCMSLQEVPFCGKRTHRSFHLLVDVVHRLRGENSMSKPPGINQRKYSMHFSITAAFGGRLATLLKLAHQRPRLDTCHFWLLSSSRARLKVATSTARERLRAPDAPKMGNALLCSMRPAPLHSGTSWLHGGRHQLGRVHLGVGASGSQIGVW